MQTRLLLALVLISAVMLATLSALQADSAQQGDPITATPTDFPPPTAPPTPTPTCGEGPPARLIVGERGRVTSDDPEGLNLRDGPNTTYEPPIMTIPAGAIFFVLGGPECSPLYTWYRVSYAGREGFIAEGFQETYFVEPYLPG